MSRLLSIIVPCFNEEEVLPLFCEKVGEVTASLKKDKDIETEYIFVDDGSKDHTLDLMRQYHLKDPRIHYISFSRNFGKEAGLYAGLQEAKGDYVCVMDADLQDPPSLLPEMIDTVEKGDYDCCATRRVTRTGESKVRSFFARLFYKLVNHGSDTEIVDGARDFRLMSRKMTDAVLSMCEYNRFSKGIFSWVGFQTKWIDYENIERAAGTTSWSFRKLCHYAIDGLVGYTTKPLEFAAWFGFFFFGISIIGILVIIIKKLAFGDPVAGWASTVVIILFCSGIQLLCTGIIGEYLAKTYLEVKNRPIYIVKEKDEDAEKK
jgi:glycosyltransferase involved in cell wall biosynthesis